ncbi:pentapeptide repeat-containing protein [Niabella sp. W65]|nr:pentapeptide repeat-containing protein [Niabella sp. W65]MCH7368929.1 pentapeptide repeat-containing protein [Niabella sp. W65]ULT44502.1 pentapeptide repeat-containing protein [Niabella sp. I65]
MKIKNTAFDNCTLHEVDFTDTDLTGASLTHCDLKGAAFDNTLLEKADLSTAYNYIIDPDRNKIKKARFSKDGLWGLLTKYNIVVQ